MRPVVLAMVPVGLLLSGKDVWAQHHGADTLAPAVVQRFVDAANLRDVPGMMTTVAPEAVFSVLPSGEILGGGQDGIRSFYVGAIADLKPGFRVEVARRIHDGSFVVDHEVFHEEGIGKPTGQATWIYWVTGGLIRHAWVLESPPRNP